MSRALLLLGPAVLLAAALMSPASSAQKFEVITTGVAGGMNADGTALTGSIHTQGAFVWDYVIEPLPPMRDGVGIAANGFVAGNTDDDAVFSEGAVWDLNVWNPLGALGATGCGASLSDAAGMSEDGTIVGIAWDGCSASPYKWTQGGGMVALPLSGTSGRADCISHDGTTIGGHDTLSNKWRACLWDENGVQTILIDGVVNSNTYGVSGSGEAAVGTYGAEGWVWTDLDGIVQIPRPAGVAAGTPTIPLDVTNDGDLVVGVFGNLIGGQGFVWERGVGTSLAVDWFPANGVTLPDDITSVSDVTPDGRTFLVNSGDVLFGFQVARIRLDGFEDLGSSFPGTYGAPKLYAAGEMTLGTPIDVQLGNALENSPAFLVVGVAAINAPFYGGTLVPWFEAPLGTYLILATDPLGRLEIPAVWPGGVPSGTPLILQYWIDDPGAAFGLAGSNAVSATVP